MNPVVSRLTVFPFKSLDGIDCSCVQTGSGSFLQGDRLYALFDARGKYINGKANPLVHALRLRADGRQFHLTSDTMKRTMVFSADSGLDAATDFLGDHFGEEVTIRKNESGKFLDVPVESAITLVSGASLRKAGEWMGLPDTDEVRRRFRANVEVDGVDAFWEDRLFGKPGEAIRFKLGAVELECVGPRERCVVPSRNSMTGDVYPGFAKKFATQRWNEMPDGSNLRDWEHGYFLCVDCRIVPGSAGQTIRIGDTLIIS